MPVATPTISLSERVDNEEARVQRGTLKLRGHHAAPQTSAFPKLDTVGWEVVKGVLTPDQANEYVQRIYKWLESFGKGFKGDDRSTWHIENMPAFAKGGLLNRHGAGQEQFAWDIRSEPKLIETFAKIWGTEELLVSMDGVNVSLPYPKEELGEDRGKAWPHVDQSPLRRFKHCIQGIMNLYENGPQDGGLMVLDGSMPLYTEYFETHEEDAPEGGWSLRDSYQIPPERLQWFYDRGCKWVKVEASPGDVILWDSRCIHYGDAARGNEPRIATYVCYKPAADITPGMAALRKEVVEDYQMTSHDPLLFRVTGTKADRERGYNNIPEDEQTRPKVLPVLSERAQKLAGTLAY